MRGQAQITALPDLLEGSVTHATTAIDAYADLLQGYPTNVAVLRSASPETP